MPNDASRRDFIKTSSVLLGMALTSSSFALKKEMPLLSFSTLGCPDWTFPDTVKFASENGYNGLEMRGILRQLDLLQCPEFNSSQNIAATLSMVKDHGLKFVDLGSSAQMHLPEGEERKKNMDDAKRFIDLAQQLQCPFIRVFPNDFPKNQDRKATIDLIVKGLLELGDYAKADQVGILMESHGEVVHTSDLEIIMKAAEHPNVGLVWDSVNMWSVTKEAPAMVYSRLKKYIRHTHIKDANIVNGKDEYVFLGKGQTPIFEAIDSLYNGGYKGYYSFEWEKLWHPDIAAPELALADYPVAMKRHFAQM